MYKYYIDTLNSETAQFGGEGDDDTPKTKLFFPPMTAVALKSEVLIGEMDTSPPPKKANPAWKWV